MNKDKIIKDLKERNEKLSNQYRLRDIRCVHLEKENADLQEKLAVVNEMNVANYNKYCEVLKENQELKRQLEYLKSGEYLNQLKFERNMLEDIVQNGGVSKEDKEFIDMTYRNTELLEQINKAIEYLKDREEDNECCFVCSVMSDKLLKILGGDVDDE